MKPSRIAAWIAAAALVLGLAACGGSSSDSGSTNAATTPATTAATTATETTASETTASDSSGGSAGGLTPPGAQLSLGETATVAWVPPSDFSVNGGQQGYKLEVTAESIEQGSIDDFKNVQLDAAQKASTPYYVKVKIKALEDAAKSAAKEDPGITVEAIDDRGQEQGSVTFLGTFERCDEKSAPKPFTAGKSYERCLTYLMPGGGSIEKVRWNSGPSKKGEITPYFSKPVVWSGS
jgi:hypothetical protein